MSAKKSKQTHPLRCENKPQKTKISVRLKLADRQCAVMLPDILILFQQMLDSI